MSSSQGSVFVDSDNALGSPRGDIDDGFALAALLRSGLAVDVLASSFGNTDAERAHRNNQRLAELIGFPGACLPGARSARAPQSPAAEYLAFRSRAKVLLALGPLTNVARALDLCNGLPDRVSHLICLGSNAASRGRWPPLWPFEFNFTKDPSALVRVFESALPIWVVPLDQARRLQVRSSDLTPIRGELGRYLRAHSARWFVRARLFKLRARVPLWDLVAVGALLWPELYRFDELSVRAHPSGWVQYGSGGRRVRVLRDFSPETVWQRSVELLSAGAPAPTHAGARSMSSP